MKLQGKCYAVIGGGGFLGSHVVDLLLTTNVREIIVFGSLRQAASNIPVDDPRIRLVEGSVTNAQSVQTVLKGVDGVFLLASLWLRECMENPRAALDINVNGAFNVLEACQKQGIERLIFASSASVYGVSLESFIDESSPLNNNTIYGATKIAVEQFLRAYNTMYQLPVMICRYTNIYGPRQASKGNSTSVVIRFLERLVNNQSPIIFGSGQNGLDYIHVKDAARATVLAMQSDLEFDVVNIASGTNTTLTELAETLIEITGVQVEPEYQNASNQKVSNFVYKTSYARQKLNFKAEISLRNGLHEMVNWYMSKGKQ